MIKLGKAEALNYLEKGYVVIIRNKDFEDYPVMGYAITQGVGLKMVTEKEQGSSYGFAVNKGQNAELLEMFNAGLANVKESGKYDEILNTYIQE